MTDLLVARPASLFDTIDITPGDAAQRRAEQLAGEYLIQFTNDRTVEGFNLDLRQWLAFLAALTDTIDPLTIRAAHVHLYVRAMNERGLAVSTVNKRLATVQRFYRWLTINEHIAKDPTVTVKRPQVPRVTTTAYMTRYQARLFLDAAKDEGGYPYALCALLVGNGLRISEALNADVSDLGIVDEYHHTLSIVGKGGKPALIGLGRRTVRAIDQALDGRELGPLLLNRWQNRMTRANASVICKRVGAIAAPGKRMHPHVLRHTAISGVARASNGNVLVAQRFARHADSSTTDRYIHHDDDLNASGSYLLEHWLAGGD